MSAVDWNCSNGSVDSSRSAHDCCVDVAVTSCGKNALAVGIAVLEAAVLVDRVFECVVD